MSASRHRSPSLGSSDDHCLVSPAALPRASVLPHPLALISALPYALFSLGRTPSAKTAFPPALRLPRLCSHRRSAPPPLRMLSSASTLRPTITPACSHLFFSLLVLQSSLARNDARRKRRNDPRGWSERRKTKAGRNGKEERRKGEEEGEAQRGGRNRRKAAMRGLARRGLGEKRASEERDGRRDEQAIGETTGG